MRLGGAPSAEPRQRATERTAIPHEAEEGMGRDQGRHRQGGEAEAAAQARVEEEGKCRGKGQALVHVTERWLTTLLAPTAGETQSPR